MPIRINLLAEQQAAEELRRKDPVKRAIWIGSAIVALVLIYSGNMQMKVSRVRGEVEAEEVRFQSVYENFVAASNSFRDLRLLQARLDALERHRTNRFLWTEPLNSLQYCAVNDVRLVRLLGTHQLELQEQRVIQTNPPMIRLAPKSWWQWWTEPPGTNVHELVGRILDGITNRADFLPYRDMLRFNIAVVTNKSGIQARIQVIRPETITEKLALTLEGRDYSDATISGDVQTQYKALYQALTNAPFFRQFFNRTNCSLQTRSVQPLRDEQDKVNPTGEFIPFVIEGRFPERIRQK